MRSTLNFVRDEWTSNQDMIALGTGSFGDIMTFLAKVRLSSDIAIAFKHCFFIVLSYADARQDIHFSCIRLHTAPSAIYAICI